MAGIIIRTFIASPCGTLAIGASMRGDDHHQPHQAAEAAKHNLKDAEEHQPGASIGKGRRRGRWLSDRHAKAPQTIFSV